jgi:uncharacterized protein YdeI (YjbR/CyaY-like superfamily)
LVVEGRAFRATATPSGEGRRSICFNHLMRAAKGRRAGDVVACEIAVDRASREIETPPDVAAALKKNAVARAAFDAMPPSHRRHVLNHLAEAKKPETRARRLAKCVTKIEEYGRERAERAALRVKPR